MCNILWDVIYRNDRIAMQELLSIKLVGFNVRSIID